MGKIICYLWEEVPLDRGFSGAGGIIKSNQVPFQASLIVCCKLLR